MQAISDDRENNAACKSAGHEELVSALINVMANDLITEIWAYVKLPSKLPEEFVNEISQLMPNYLTLIIWEYVMCQPLYIPIWCVS
jgi:hypothetical protein